MNKRNPVVQAAAVATTVFLVSFVLVPCLSAPVQDTTVSVQSAETVWWHNACGVSHTTKMPHRHRGHKGLSKPQKNRLRTSLILARDQFNDVWNKAGKTYAAVQNEIAQDLHFSQTWISRPKYSVPMDSIETVDLLLEFYKDIQKFAIVFDALSTVESNSEIAAQVIEDRKTIFAEGIFATVKNILCEVEQAINNSGSDVPAPRLGSEFFYEAEQKMIQQPSLADMIVQDLSVIQRYREYLKDWIKLMNKVRTSKNRPENKTNKSKKNNKPRKQKNKKPNNSI